MMLSFKDLVSPTWKAIHKHHTENHHTNIQRGRQTGVDRQASKQSDRYREDGQDDTDTTRQIEIIRGRQTYLHYEE